MSELPDTTMAIFAAASSPTRLAVGVDLVEVERIAATLARFDGRFLARVYTPAELAITGRNPSRLAGRFAVKEACAKALGTGIDGPRWRDIECLRDAAGKPLLYLHRQAAQQAHALRWQALEVSISTTHRFSIALVVALGDVAPPLTPPHSDEWRGELNSGSPSPSVKMGRGSGGGASDA